MSPAVWFRPVAWTKRRRLFLIETLAFLACMIVGIVLEVSISTLTARLVVASCMFAVMMANIVLRLTYFRAVLPELREERERKLSGS